MSTTLSSLAVLACLIVAAACGGSSPTSTPSPSPTPTIGQTVTPAGEGQGPTPIQPNTPTAEVGPTSRSGEEPTATAEISRTDTATPKPASDTLPAPVLLSLHSPSEARIGGELVVDLRVDPEGRGISGVQARIRYDNAVLLPFLAVPGPLLGDEPVEVPLIINEEEGWMEYVAARVGVTQPPTQPDVAASITFQVLEDAPTGVTTALEIIGAKMPDENIEEIAEIAWSGAVNVAILE